MQQKRCRAGESIKINRTIQLPKAFRLLGLRRLDEVLKGLNQL